MHLPVQRYGLGQPIVIYGSLGIWGPMELRDKLPLSDEPSILNTPLPRPLYLRITYLCAERKLSRAKLIFHAIN